MSQRKKNSHIKPNDVAVFALGGLGEVRSEEHTSELQSPA